jgi:hypothetical protein
MLFNTRQIWLWDKRRILTRKLENRSCFVTRDSQALSSYEELPYLSQNKSRTRPDFSSLTSGMVPWRPLRFYVISRGTKIMCVELEKNAGPLGLLQQTLEGGLWSDSVPSSTQDSGGQNSIRRGPWLRSAPIHRTRPRISAVGYLPLHALKELLVCKIWVLAFSKYRQATLACSENKPEM